MIEITRNNVRHIRSLTDAEKRAALAWHRNLTTSQIIQLKLQRGGRFCVVQGDYSRRSTNDIRKELTHLAEIGAHRSPAARFLGRELMQRSAGCWSTAPGNPDGPQAA